MLKGIAKFLTFLGIVWFTISAICMWFVPFLFNSKKLLWFAFQSFGHEMFMFITSFSVMLTGMIFWFLLEKKKK